MSVTIVGMGMGTTGTLTADTLKALSEADVLIGAARLLDTLTDNKTAHRYPAVLTDDILEIIGRHPESNICVLMSGDVGFYSGAKKLVLACPEALLIPGVSNRR
jgi:precorrin-6Y C5,15-methyltransferase (decarboxylating)